MLSLTLLVENTARGAGVLGEHGLAWWIDTGTHRVLFDTGQGLALRHNATQLGVDLSRADAIVLSHGHYDHVGGLEGVLAVAKGAVLYLHPRATEPKFSGSDGGTTGRRISVDYLERGGFRAEARRVVVTREAVEVVPGVWTTGEVPRRGASEDTGGPFFLDAAMTQPDPLEDDQAIFVKTARGLVGVFGCAHAGALNTLDRISELSGKAPVRALFGGLHLERAGRPRLDRTVDRLRELHPGQMGFCHCTGCQALRRLWSEFPDTCVQAAAGSRFVFPD